jgi:Xaa-Pro aminopeptidase
MIVVPTTDSTIFKERRKKLLQSLKTAHSAAHGVLLLISNYECDAIPFKQEPSFYYFTGLNEPAALLLIDIETEKETLYVPNMVTERKKWVTECLDATVEQAAALGIDEIQYSGEKVAGYAANPYFSAEENAQFLSDMQKRLAKKRVVFTPQPAIGDRYLDQRFILLRLMHLLPELAPLLKDCSAEIAQLRRKKDPLEIQYIKHAIDITIEAQEAAASALYDQVIEYEVAALIEYTFAAAKAGVAFSSIVASGINSTILHHTKNDRIMKNGDLVVVDIGASWHGYAADITRTFPVGGMFTDRQCEIYQHVLDTQDYIASIAKPGMWLSNKNQPEKSLNHLARAFLAERGYADAFLHGIGHFLGLEVHDVGDYMEPLAVGDVITIEPGIYLPQEAIGVRIEDNYLLTEDGVECLSEGLIKDPHMLEEALAAREYAEEEY